MEEFEKAIGTKIGYIGLPSEKGIIQMLKEEDVKSFLLYSQLSIIQAIDEWAEKMKHDDRMIICGTCGSEDCHVNIALSALRSFLSGTKDHNNKL